MATLTDRERIVAEVLYMAAGERVALLDELRECFCLYCGEDYPSYSPGVCHCTNDE